MKSVNIAISKAAMFWALLVPIARHVDLFQNVLPVLERPQIWKLLVNPREHALLLRPGALFNHVLHRDVRSVLNYALVQVTNNVLNDTELLEKLAPGVQHLVREHILFSVDPQVGKAFLSGVEDLGQVA